MPIVLALTAMVVAIRTLTTLAIVGWCWGCSAAPKGAVAPPVAQAPLDGTEVAATDTGNLSNTELYNEDLDGTKTYGEVRPRLSQVITLGEVTFPQTTSRQTSTSTQSPAPQVVVVNNNNNVHQSTYVSRPTAPSWQTSKRVFRPIRARTSRPQRSTHQRSSLRPVGASKPDTDSKPVYSKALSPVYSKALSP